MKITIMGAAGTLGSCAAFTIAIHKLANEIVLIDPGAEMLKAHWMDLNTVAAAQDVLVNRGNFADMAGSDIVVITSGAPSGITASRADLITGNLPMQTSFDVILEYVVLPGCIVSAASDAQSAPFT